MPGVEHRCNGAPRLRATPARYFDTHLHVRDASDAGFDEFLAMLEVDEALLGGNLVINTVAELSVVLRRTADIPPWLQLVPSLELTDDVPNALRCGWVKIHPSIQRIRRGDIPQVVSRTKLLCPGLRGVMVHCFPWGEDLEFNCSIELVSALAKMLPDRWILATHGGGYESWSVRAHLGGFKNVLFDFSASLAYYAGSDLLRPLERYLTHSPNRVLFGTDWPSATVEEQWREMLRWAGGAGVDEATLESMLLDNSVRVWPTWKARR